MHRLFVALRPPAEVRAKLIGIMGGIADARWQDDEQLHITLRYIGEVATPVAEDVATALEGVRAPSLTLGLAGVGCFDGDRRPGGAVWAGVSPRGEITALHHKIDRAIVGCGLPPERRAFLPHVTLARMSRRTAAPDRFLIEQAALSMPPFTLDHFLLYESDLGPDGASYSAVARYPLRS